MIRVGRSGWQRLLESLAGGRLPFPEVLPEQAIEIPHQAVAVRCERAQPDVLMTIRLGAWTQRAHRLEQLALDRGDLGLPEVHRNLRQRQHLAPGVGCPANDDRIAEVAAVVNPVEMHAERRRQLRIEDAVLDHRHHAAGDERTQIAFGLAGRCTPGLPASDVVDVNDHLMRWYPCRATRRPLWPPPKIAALVRHNEAGRERPASLSS